MTNLALQPSLLRFSATVPPANTDDDASQDQPTTPKATGKASSASPQDSTTFTPKAHTKPLAKTKGLRLPFIKQSVKVPNGKQLQQGLLNLPKSLFNKAIQVASLALSVLSMGALFFIPGINLLTPMGIVLAMGVLALNEGVALLADKRGVKTLHSGEMITDALQKPGEWAIRKGMTALPNVLFGDTHGQGKADSLKNLLLKNQVFATGLAKSLEQTPMFADVSQDLRNRSSVAGKAWVLVRSVGGLIPSILLARFLPGKKGAVFNAMLYNVFGTKINHDPESVIRKQPQRPTGSTPPKT
jgi:hypothetical protein